jgi:hypothetical protein
VRKPSHGGHGALSTRLSSQAAKSKMLNFINYRMRVTIADKCVPCTPLGLLASQLCLAVVSSWERSWRLTST